MHRGADHSWLPAKVVVLLPIAVLTGMFLSGAMLLARSEALSTRERMSEVLERLKDGAFVPFVELFSAEEGRLGVVVTFMAVLELIKESLVELVQNEPFAVIHVRARAE